MTRCMQIARGNSWRFMLAARYQSKALDPVSRTHDWPPLSSATTRKLGRNGFMWMDEIHFAPPKKVLLKPLFVGIDRLIIIPGFLRCRICASTVPLRYRPTFNETHCIELLAMTHARMGLNQTHHAKLLRHRGLL